MDSFRSLLGRAYLRIFGWRVEAPADLPARFVVIGAPHTSNWDLPFMLAASYVLGLRVHWLGKHTLFTPPLGWLLRWVGGIPVDRRSRHRMVEQIADLFGRSERLVLAIPPEGTRGKVEYWKSGFYHVAQRAGVPVALGFLDYGKRVSGIGAVISLTGDVRADMERIRAFYRDIRGKYPENDSVPRLREEDQKSM